MTPEKKILELACVIIFVLFVASFVCIEGYGVGFQNGYSVGFSDGVRLGYDNGHADGIKYQIRSEELSRNWTDAGFYNINVYNGYTDPFRCYYRNTNRDLWVCVNITTLKPDPGYSWSGIDITKYLPGWNSPLTSFPEDP